MVPAGGLVPILRSKQQHKSLREDLRHRDSPLVSKLTDATSHSAPNVQLLGLGQICHRCPPPPPPRGDKPLMGTTADNWNEGKLGHVVTTDSYFASEPGSHVQSARLTHTFKGVNGGGERAGLGRERLQLWTELGVKLT